MHIILPTSFKSVRFPADGGHEAWEFKNFNRHCVILNQVIDHHDFDLEHYLTTTRRCVQREFRPNIFRGLALGTILELPDYVPGVERIADCIDTRQRGRIVWQWAIIAMRGARTALGIHTWMAVYLTPFHNQVLQEYASDGFTVDTFKRDKDRLVETLSKISGMRLPEIEP